MHFKYAHTYFKYMIIYVLIWGASPEKYGRTKRQKFGTISDNF